MVFAQGSLASVLLLATCSLPISTARVLERDLVATSLTQRSFEGFTLGYYDDLSGLDLPVSCQNALQQRIYCDYYVSDYVGEPAWRGYIDTEETTFDSVCDDSCGASIRSYWDGIVKECAGYKLWGNGTITLDAGRLWEAWNETCYYDPESGRNCNEIINQFAEAEDIEHMPLEEMCSFCQVEHYRMMQRSPYSAYDYFWQKDLETINKNCGLDIPTEIPSSLNAATEDNIFCDSQVYTVQQHDTCVSIAKKYNVSSEDVQVSYASHSADELGSSYCDQLRPGRVICLPPPCKIYELQAGDTCASIEAEQHFSDGASLRTYNSWIDPDCANLPSHAMPANIVCVSPRSGEAIGSSEGLSSSVDAASSTSSRVSTTHISASSTGAASTTGSHITSSRPTEIASMATSGPSGAKLTAPTAGNSASATPSTSSDNVSGASMAGPDKLQVVVVLAALVLSQMV